jgi:hypothetical protein
VWEPFASVENTHELPKTVREMTSWDFMPGVIVLDIQHKCVLNKSASVKKKRLFVSAVRRIQKNVFLSQESRKSALHHKYTR